MHKRQKIRGVTQILALVLSFLSRFSPLRAIILRFFKDHLILNNFMRFHSLIFYVVAHTKHILQRSNPEKVSPRFSCYQFYAPYFRDMPLREKETVSESGDIFLKKRRGPFQFIFFLRNFFYDFRRIRLPPPTASVSAPSRRLCAQPTGKLRQSTQPGGNGQNNPAAHRVSPPKKENENFGRPRRLRYLPRLSFQYPLYAQAQSND